jgi:predicted transcriptional regulator of viral defense system
VARARAAVLASGPAAVVSHRSAAELWGLMPESTGDVHVTVVGRNPGVRAGIQAHRVAKLPAAEVRKIRGIPLTSPARTICDIAGSEPSGEIEPALEEARVRRLVTDRALWAVIERAPMRNGSGLMRTLLAADLDSGFTRSEAERRLRRTLRELSVRCRSSTSVSTAFSSISSGRRRG